MKNIKSLEIYLRSEVQYLYNEKCQVQMREINKDQNKWRHRYIIPMDKNYYC